MLASVWRKVLDVGLTFRSVYDCAHFYIEQIAALEWQPRKTRLKTSTAGKTGQLIRSPKVFFSFRPHNNGFLGPRVDIPNSMLIVSAVLTQPSVVSNRVHTDHATTVTTVCFLCYMCCCGLCLACSVPSIYTFQFIHSFIWVIHQLMQHRVCNSA